MTDGHSEAMAGDLEGSSKEYLDESVDPRVQIELERLNAATDLINELETELDEARSNFRLLLSETSNRVNHLANKLGACVEKARPYYEARMQAKQLQSRTQKAALRYERASSAHSTAKEMVYLAEEGLKNQGRCFDPAWQEMLNHATMRVNDAESERLLSKHDHQHTSLSYNEAERVVQQLHQEFKKSITKSSLSTRRSLLQLNNLSNQHQLQLLPYFEMKAQFNQLLDEQRQKVHKLEENVMKVKISYADALHNLETISDEIHQRRDMADKQSSNGVCPAENSQKAKLSDSFADIFNNSISDTYKSLPKKFGSRGTISRSVLLEKRENKQQSKLASNYTIDTSELAEKHRYNTASLHKELSCPELLEKLNNSTARILRKSEPIPGRDCLPNAAVNEFENLTLGQSNGISHSFLQGLNKSPEAAELLAPKYETLDLNILRIQKESDSESLASTDTADTLDECQIECLLLEQVLPTDDQLVSSFNNCSLHNNEN